MEILRLEVPDRVIIFKLPPTSTAKGYNFGDWKELVWEGSLKIFETSDDKLIIRFYSRDGKQFAMLEVPENHEDAIIKCEDSVRGYALRLVNPKGGYTWIGLGFRDRNTAFDFRSRIIDFSERKVQDSDKSKMMFQQVDDLRLNQGEKISFNIGGMGAAKQQKPKENISNFTFSMPGQQQPQQSFSFNPVQTTTTTTTNSGSSSSTGAWDDWSNFGNSSSNDNSNANNAQKQTDFFSDFSDFSNFGNTQPQQQQQFQQSNWSFGGNQPAQQNNNSNNAQQTTQNKPTTINLLDL